MFFQNLCYISKSWSNQARYFENCGIKIFVIFKWLLSFNNFNVATKDQETIFFTFLLDKTSGPEKYRAAWVSSDTSCTCYDFYGATCYAICGKLL